MMKKLKIKVLIMLLLALSIVITIDVKAEDILAEPYIDITFDNKTIENKNHGTVDLFNETGTEYYNNSNIKYGFDAYGTYMKWTSTATRGGGFNLNVDKAIGGNYTIALKFSYSDTGENDGGWRKIIDFQKPSPDADSGFYFYNYGQIQFYPEGSSGPYIKNNEVVDLLIRRNIDTNKFEVYNRVGDESKLAYEFVDTEHLSVLDNGLGFFHDDFSTDSEASMSGKVYGVKIWDEYVDVDEVWEILDKDREEAVTKYICLKVNGEIASDIMAGWKSYYKCIDNETNETMYYEDENYSTEIVNVDKWKNEEGYISQTKSIEEIMHDIEETIKNINEGNVTSEYKDSIIETKEIINKVRKLKISSADNVKLDEFEAKCDSLISKINSISNILEEADKIINKYSGQELNKEAKNEIIMIIDKLKEVNINNLTDAEKKILTSKIEKLEDILNSNSKIDNKDKDDYTVKSNDNKENIPDTNDMIIYFIAIGSVSLVSILLSYFYIIKHY